MRFGFAALALLVFALPRAAQAESSALILTGIGGSTKHTQKFTKWTDDTRKLLVDKFGFLPERVVVVADTNATKENVAKAFDAVKGQLKPTDTFFLFFIGHGDPWEIPGTTTTPVDLQALANQQGASRGRGAPAPRSGGSRSGGRAGAPVTPLGLMDYKFNLSGPDLTGTEYSQMLPQVARIVIINTTNSSGASLETMAGKNRVLITATRSGSEVNDTIFYEHFLAGLQDLASDEDKDKKVSLWEAFKFASDGVERYYKDQGRLATEHPMLSDNGLEAINTTAKDAPVLARYTVLNVDRVASTTNPRLQTLLEERREIELKMAELRLSERTMKPEEFEKQLQELILALAQKTAEIRAQEKK